MSLITPGVTENWGTTHCPSASEVCKEEILEGMLEPYSCRRRRVREMSPYRDFYHFTGDRKPWWSNQTLLEQDLLPYPIDLNISEVNFGKAKAPSKLNFRQEWYWHLKVALTEIGMAEQVLSLGFIVTSFENASFENPRSIPSVRSYVRFIGRCGEDTYAGRATRIRRPIILRFQPRYRSSSA